MDNTKTLFLCYAIENDYFETFVVLIGESDYEISKNAMRFINESNIGDSDVDLSPFLLCAKYGRYEMLQYLLNIPGVDVNQRDVRERNALAHIIFANPNNGTFCAKLFLSNALFNINTLIKTALMHAVTKESQFEIVKLLLKYEEIEVSVPSGTFVNTALICASRSCITVNMRLLLRHQKVFVNETNWRAQTALLAFVDGYDSERDLLSARQLLNQPNINVNYVYERNSSANSMTFDREQFLTHAMLTHGRI
jgi:hypothetical protein